MFNNRTATEKEINVSEGYTELVEGSLKLTSQGKITITDEFALGKTIKEIKHKYFIPTSIIKSGVAKNKSIESDCNALMSGAMIDEATEEETTYIKAPTTLTGLKTACKAYHEGCDTDAFNNVVDKVVGSTGTWTQYKTSFNE